MKKGILLLLAMMSLATVTANNIKIPTSKIGVVNRFNDAVTFVERGVQFHVFLNGDFDFNTNYRNSYIDYNGRRFTNQRGIRIERDFNDRIRRVGNVFVNYDHRGNVTRIGNVFIRYKFGRLFKVGNLRIKYDRWGHPRYKGFVKPGRHYDDYYYEDDRWDINVNIDICDYDDVYFYKRDFRNNYRQFREDDNFFYYRALPNAKIGKRSKILKRRKPSKHNSEVYYKENGKRKDKSKRRNR